MKYLEACKSKLTEKDLFYPPTLTPHHPTGGGVLKSGAC